MQVEYTIDGGDILFACNQAWADFAEANDAPEMTVPAGDRTLWSYLSGDEVRGLWHLVVSQVRATGRPLHVPYRCDAPGARRWFDMTVSPGPNDEVHFRSALTREEARPVVALLGRYEPRDPAGALLRVCSWCNRCHDDTDWVTLEDLLRAQPELLSVSPLRAITHGICPPCEAELLDAADL